MTSSLHVIGLISGTSADGIDAAFVEITGAQFDLQVKLLAGQTYAYPESIRQQILSVGSGAVLSMAALAELDDAIAHCFAQAALQIQADQPPADLIASHGQTVFHRPPRPAASLGTGSQPAASRPAVSLGYSLQLGRGDAIAHLTGIPTISNFRAADIAAGGHGAPLVPPVDIALLSHPDYSRCIQNIGGIGNVAYLPPRAQALKALGDRQANVLGWDTGPGNMLIDLAVQHFSNGTQTYDANGNWAAQGNPCEPLVQEWLQQDFFQQPPPKSTGREQFGQDYLHQCLRDAEPHQLSPADLLATLVELTAVSIEQSYRRFLPCFPDQVLLCGGGSHNTYLKNRLQHHLDPAQVLTTAEAGVDPDFKEAIAFAVIGFWRYFDMPGNLPSVTGAVCPTPLGDFYPIRELL